MIPYVILMLVVASIAQVIAIVALGFVVADIRRSRGRFYFGEVLIGLGRRILSVTPSKSTLSPFGEHLRAKRLAPTHAALVFISLPCLIWIPVVMMFVRLS